MKAILCPILVMLAAVPVWGQEPERIPTDAFGYARVGYGGVLGEGGSTNPVIGFGGRARMDRFGIDASILNVSPSARGVGVSPGAAAFPLVKVEALYYVGPKASASAYFGGGMSWGAVSGWYDAALPKSSSPSTGDSSWGGSGLQGELTAGYELPRAGALRAFVQADATLPFYQTSGQSYASADGRPITIAVGRRYNPSIALSVGVGWQ